jgi:hypothetical protein
VPRQCSVCYSPHREAVDHALGRGTPANQIGKTFALGERAVQRHRVAHLSPAIVTVMTEERTATRIVDRLEALVEKVSRLVTQAEKEGSAGLMLAACREVRAGLELLARLSGELDERPTTQVLNILQSPDVAELLSTAMEALAPERFAEARIVVATAWKRLEAAP